MFAVFDADVHREYVRQFRIDTYPTILYFSPYTATKPLRYEGEVTLDGLMRFTEEMMALSKDETERRAGTSGQRADSAAAPVTQKGKRKRFAVPDPNEAAQTETKAQRKKKKKTRRYYEDEDDEVTTPPQSTSQAPPSSDNGWHDEHMKRHEERMQQHERQMKEMQERHDQIIKESLERHERHMDEVMKRHAEIMDEVHRRMESAIHSISPSSSLGDPEQQNLPPTPDEQ